MPAKKPTKKVALEQVFKPKCPTIFGYPIAIIDFRVALHGILGSVGQFATYTCTDIPLTEPNAEGLQYPDISVLVEHPLWANWVRACWAIKLNRGPDMLPRAKYRVIVLDDSKQDGLYWRGIVFPSYKGNRTQESARDNCYQSIRDIGWALVTELKFPIYSKPLYEADDWAGLVYRLKTTADKDSLLYRRELYLSSIDSDWTQLVDDAASILWANTGPWISRLKNEAEVRAYVLKRMGVRITKPSEVAAVKQHQGDTADELPAGADLSLFDLINVNLDYNLDILPEAVLLLKDLSDPEPNTNHEHLQKAVAYCNQNGLPIVARP